MRAVSTVGSRFCSPGISLGVGVVKSTKPHLEDTPGVEARVQLKDTLPLGLTVLVSTLKFWMQLEFASLPFTVEQIPLIVTPCIC